MNAVGSGAITAALTRASQATGVDFRHLLETAKRESSLNPQARAPTSSAAGLFQFIERTWLEMIRRHGAAHGLSAEAAQVTLRDGRPVVDDPAARKAILDLRHDPELAARMAAELTRENAAHLERRLGRPPTATELYAAHVMGPAGAVKLVEAAGEGARDAAALFPREAQSNPWLFYDRQGAPRSAQGLLDRLALDGAGDAPPLAQAAPSPAAAEPDLRVPAAREGLSGELLMALLALQELPSVAGVNDSEPERSSAPELALLRAGVYGRLVDR